MTDETLFEETGVRIAFTERHGRVAVRRLEGRARNSDFPPAGDRGTVFEVDAKSPEGSQLIGDALGVAHERVIKPAQVHGSDVVVVEKPGLGDFEAAQRRAGQGADAVVVAQPGYAALLLMADCLPLVLVAPGGMFAVVHCGWRGTIKGIAGKAFEQLLRVSGQPASQCNAYIGPYIHVECFEVGEDVSLRFAEAFGADCAADARHVDLAVAVRADLAHKGLAPRRIADAGICTTCAVDRFFSYRAESGQCGRHGAFCFRR